MTRTLNETDLINGFRALGVKRHMMIEVHCAMSSFGNIQGGEETIIKALKK